MNPINDQKTIRIKSAGGTPQALAVIAAGGVGSRFGSDKMQLSIQGESVLERSCRIFEKLSSPLFYVVVAHARQVEPIGEALSRNSAISHCLAVVSGGDSRQQSVLRGLSFLVQQAQEQGWGELPVLVHDGARCLLQPSLIENCLAAIRSEHCGVGLAVPATQTIRILSAKGSRIEQTPPRHLVQEMQTPQGSDLSVLYKAYLETEKRNQQVTDDLAALESIGYPIRLITGDRQNIKITWPEDVATAQWIIQQKRDSFT